METAARLRVCERRWGVQILSVLDGGHRSAVFAGRAAGRDVVVKLTVTRGEAIDEAVALHAWRHTGAAVELLDVDTDLRALLLRRVSPGTPLARDHLVPAATAADLLNRLHSCPNESHRFRSLTEVYPELERVALDDIDFERRTRSEPTRGEAGLRCIEAARSSMRRLCASTTRTTLLHGDFLLKNLLLDTTGYIAIDPKPRTGDPCADIGFFASDHASATILARSTEIAECLGADAERARRWAAVWTVLQTVSAWRDDQRELERLVASDEVARLLRA